MSASQRKAIRLALATRLSGAVTFTPANYIVNGRPMPGEPAPVKVYNARILPFDAPMLPAIAVYALNEESEKFDEAPRRYKRTVEIVAEVVVQATDVYADIADDLMQQVEQLIAKDVTLNKQLSDGFLHGVRVEMRAEGAQPIIAQGLVIDGVYYTFWPDAADVPLPAFTNFTVTYNLGNNQPPGTLPDGNQLQDAEALEQYTITVATKAGGNTGNGTCGGVSGAQNTAEGAYVLTLLSAANGGYWSVTAPDGEVLLGAQTGIAYANDQLNFTITQGDTVFIPGDGFTITFQ